MPPVMTVKLLLTDDVTLDDLREFVRHADQVDADGGQEVRRHDDNGDLVELEAYGLARSDG